MQDATTLWEIRASILNPRSSDPINSVKFSYSEELLWSGSDEGSLYANAVPELERYCSFKAHQQQILDVLPLPPSVGDGVLSLSAEAVQYHASGGCPRFVYNDAEQDLTACLVDTQFPQIAILGRATGQLSTVDIQTGRLITTVGPVTNEVTLMRSPLPRSLLAVAGSSGEVVLVDPNRQFKLEHSIKAHTSNVVAMDVSGSLLATAGLGTRQGQLVHDTTVKVYDLRSTARVMQTIPFSAGPSLLRFHPRLQGTLLIAAASGQFVMSHVQSASYASLMQVDTEGDLLTSVDFSSSGECLAFGGSGGFVHLWGFNSEPRANLRSSPIEIPPLVPQPETTMDEDQPFSIPAQLPYTEDKLLSDWDPRLMGQPGLPPRVVDSGLLKDIKQVDFVTYIPNPHFRRGKAIGEAAKKVATLRNKRVRPSVPLTDGAISLTADATQAAFLPDKYRRVHITLDMDRRYEEFDFSKYNQTRFAGLENGIANCYANALIQVLYFIPRLRSCFLGVTPDASLEFSLLDELALCFRMLASEAGHACQATNLLRALRQSREATGLGLLEGHQQQGSRPVDIEVEANKDQSLARRVQRLQRFLLDKVHHELLKRRTPEEQETGSQAAVLEQEVEGGAAGHGAKGTLNALQAEGVGESDVSGQPPEKLSAVEETFGMKMKQTMQGLQGSKPSLNKEIQCFQVDLQYPRRSKTSTTTGSSLQPAEKELSKPSFSEVLASSLRAEGETRAWFNDQLKYQYVRQTRQPLGFPRVLTVGTNLQDRGNRVFWQPSEDSKPLQGASEQSWAPLALALESADREVRALQADSAEELPEPSSRCETRAVYELTAVVALVQEERVPSGQGQGKEVPEAEGHLVAHVQVPPSYLDKEVGVLPTPRAKPPSPGYASSYRSRAVTQFQPGPGVPEHPFEGLPDDPFGEIAAEQAMERAGAAEEHGLPDDPFGDASLLAAPGTDGVVQGREAAQSAEAGHAEGSEEQAGAEASLERLPEQFKGLEVIAKRSDSFPAGEPTFGKADAEPVWLLINDFSICQTPKAEALQLFNGHKLPCLLYYTQVSALQWGSRQEFKVVPRPVPMAEGHLAFHALCRQPPLQASLVGLHRLSKPTFTPLSQEEGPQPGLILGLDAEFVAFSPPSKALRGGVEIETAPSRLGLARVSVVRGEGTQAGQACIDDYIPATEPVYDYLTQFSGLRAGDLDPAMSQHHLTTLKASYLKLRFLADAGCIFVGHGLKKDFRMINMLVPPEQMVDTVNLFYMKKQRKISLRFLAAYLLKQDIQQTTHDSIEDARTALNLYKLFARLRREGRVKEVVESMYAWGKQYSWDQTVLKDHPVTLFS